MTIWFCVDNHHGHRNIIKHTARPYSSVEEMDEALIANWNRRVTTNDEVWVLGDFSFRGKPGRIRPIFDRLNGNKFLVIGNHDNDEVIGLPWSETPTHYQELLIPGRPESPKTDRIIMSHYPMRSWNAMYHGSIHLHGHTHGNIQNYQNSCDVGIDCCNYAPVTLAEIKARIATAPKNPDHT